MSSSILSQPSLSQPGNSSYRSRQCLRLIAVAVLPNRGLVLGDEEDDFKATRTSSYTVIGSL